MRFIFKRLKRLIKFFSAAWLFVLALLYMLCRSYMDSPADVAVLACVITSCFVIALAAVLICDYDDYARNNPDGRLIKDSFGGFSKKSQLFYSSVENLRLGQLAQALEGFSEAAELDPDQRENALLCFYKAECYRFMGYNTNAGIWYVKAAENEINEDSVYVLAARSYTAAGSYSMAMDLYKTAEDKGVMYEGLYTDMGMCCLRWERPDEALSCFGHSLELGSNVAFAYGGCAVAYIMKKEVEKSGEFYKKALVSGLNDLKGFIEFYRSAAEASGCTEDIREFSRLTLEEEKSE